MNNLIYLFQVASIFSVLYILYIVFLERLTFHQLNRIVLLLILPISVIIPFLDNLFPFMVTNVIEVPVFEYFHLNTISAQLPIVEQPIATSSINYIYILITIYIVVLSIFLIRILSTAINLFKLKHTSKSCRKNGYKLIIANVPEAFSYFNWVFIPESNFEQLDSEIIEHEKTHIKLNHSWDVLLTEIYIAFFWFNPLLYFYRKSLKSVHEFQADKGVLATGIKTSQYMQVLLQHIEVSKPNNSYNYFSQPILKRRVTMMTKPKSNALAKVKYAILLPVCVFLISAFTTPIIEDNKYLNVLDIPELNSAAPSLFPVQNATRNNITSHFGENAKHPKSKKIVTHHGIDIKAEIGTPIFATADGIIAKASMEGDWGNLIIMMHSDGYETLYAHLNNFNVTIDQEVKKGEIIGFVGNTGLSSGPHLHYEVKQNGKRLNPTDYLD